MTLHEGEDYLLNESFENNSEFGYITVLDNSDEDYELVVGLGDVKITTVIEGKELAKQAEIFMQIVKSIQYK